MLFQYPQSVGQPYQLRGKLAVNAGFLHDDTAFQFWLRVVETQSDKTLAGRRFHPLEQVLVSGVVGNHQHEFRRCVQNFPGTINRQDAAVIGQWMQNYGSVLAGFHHFVQIADCTFAHRSGQRAIVPVGFTITDQVSPY